MGGAWRLSLEKESILNNIIDDLERRNRNWDSIDAELANNALLTASIDEEFKKRAILFDTLQEMLSSSTLVEGSGCLVLGDEEDAAFVASVFRVSELANVPPNTLPEDIVNLANGLVAYKTTEIQGGGGGGTGGGYVKTKMTMLNETGWNFKTLLLKSECKVSFNWSSTEEDMPTGNGVVQVTANGAVRYTGAVQQGRVELKIDEYLILGDNFVRVEITDAYGWKRALSFNISVFVMEMKSSFSTESVFTGNINYSFIPTGEALKIVHFIIDGKRYTTMEVAANNREQHIVLPKQAHGSHTLSVYFTAVIDGQAIQSNTLNYDLICTEAGVETPILASAFIKTDFVRYERALIPYRAFTPNMLNSTVDFYVDGVKTDTIEVDRNEHIWAYKFNQSGTRELKIVTGGVEKVFNFNISELDIPIAAETNALSLHLNSADRSNNRDDREIWNYGSVAANLNNFTFVKDGWQLDSDGATCLRVSGGARVEIPFNIFTGDFRNTGKTIEIEFTTRDVLNYDATIISSMNGGIGLKITAQRAYLESEQIEIMTQYKEDEHVRLSFVVEKKTDHRLILCYINGVLSRSVQYPLQDNFSQNVPVGITIGSDDCTTDIYSIRVYDNNLTRDQLLDNWIADTQNFEQLVERYKENDIFDQYGNIVIGKLPDYLPYLVLTAPELPQFKGDKKVVTGRYVDPRNPKRSFTFVNGQADVQGTSSAGYSRKNYKIKFNSGIVLNGVQTEGFAIKDGDIAVNTFTFKADVASSEGANNTMLVKTYNDTVPYKTPPQVLDARVRQGIDGFPIVIFHDNGATIKFVGKYNFNNDKNNLEVFGFEGTDQSWEILNNTSNRTLFKSGDFSTDDWMNDFEARQPEDFTDITELSAMVQWVASTDQEAATGAALPSSVLYDGVTHTKDTAAYRLAKFKNEADTWFELDSVIYYYIFTELFMMSDSRAKNAFPTKFHNSKWCFLPYDMDTGIGTNNEGALVFDYYLEDIDTLDGADVFNGQKSVLWINTRQAFYDDIKTMYQDLRSEGKLSYETVSTAFTKHQSAWSQVIFNEDAYFKYLEPLFENNETIYLPMLQGDKAEQRKWWLYNRFRYLDSKYQAGDSLTSFITLRGYAKDNITLTPYADIYAAVKYGSYLVQERALRGSNYILECPLDNLNDTEIYIYSAAQIKDVGDLSGLKVGLAEFAHASKLENIKIGDGTVGYTNPNLTNLSVGNNTLLRSIDVRNCVNLSMPVDFSGCDSIEDLYFQGTAITALVLPDGGRIKNLHLPSTITNLTLVNQQNLAVLDVPSFKNITTLRIENSTNVPYNNILSQATSLARIRLVNAEIYLDDKNLLYSLFGLKGLDQNNSNIEKPVITGTCHIPEMTEQSLRYFEKGLPELDITYDQLGHDFTVTFVDWNGTVLDVQKLKRGEYATNPVTRDVLPIPAPSRKAGSNARYVFENNWDKDFASTQTNMTVMAVYKTITKFSITFVNWNGAILDVQQLETGQYATNPVTRTVSPIPAPTRPTNSSAYYYFENNWDKAFETLQETAVVTAVFREVYRYTATFKNWNGTTLYTKEVLSGQTITNPVVDGVLVKPERPGDASFPIYLYRGWDKPFEAAVGDITFTATYSGKSSIDLYELAVDADFEWVKSPSGYLVASKKTTKGYYKYIGTKQYVTVPSTINGDLLRSTYFMFKSNTTIKGVMLASGNAITDMNSMFRDLKSTVLDLSHFNTDNVLDMTEMFYNSKATTLDLSSFNTANVTSMNNMFYMSSATTINVSSFNTTNVTNMSNMFNYSYATTLDLSSFNTTNVTDMRGMFKTSDATVLDLRSFNTTNVTNMDSMFISSRANKLDLSSFNTTNVTNMNRMFNTSYATTIDLSSFNTTNVTNMSNMFSYS